jgi:hypothetical protein
MPSLFYEIFNDIVQLDEKTLQKFLDDISDIYKELKKQ